jgi:hypothetical protein
MACSFLAALGLAWDIRWHGAVGRDQFWTPPHVLIYSGVFFAGLTCLAVVLFETERWWRRPRTAPNDGTVSFLGVFHAPLGFFVAGFGYLTLLLAAPLDDYWHQLYGVDVALWTPFHVMGLIGGGISGLGTAYVLGGIAARARARGDVRLRLLGFSGTELLLLFALSGLMHLLLASISPATWQHPAVRLGPVEALTYPILLALVLTLLFGAAVCATARPGAASVAALLYALRQLGYAAFVPWAIRTSVAQQGLEYRIPGYEPHFRALDALAPLVVVGVALIVDTLAARLARSPAQSGSHRAARAARGRPLVLSTRDLALAGALAAVPLTLYAFWQVPQVIQNAPSLGIPPEIVVPPVPGPGAFVAAAPAALLAGALGMWLGGGLGAMLRLNQR